MNKASSSFDALDLAGIEASAILNSLPDGVYLTDTDRRILFWNREAERMTGFSAAEVIGHRCHENILCHIDKDGHLLCGHEHCPLHRAMVTGVQSELPSLIYAKRRDGRRIPVEVTVSPVRNTDGVIIGGIEVFRDLSPAFQDLNRARIIQRESMGKFLPPDDRFTVSIRHTPRDLVGGDYHRIELVRKDVAAILLADVVGHGISSALYAMQLRSLWEDGRTQLDDPGVFLDWLSHRVEALTDTDAGYFATAVHAVYHAGTGLFQCGTAGHPTPLIIRKDGTQDRLNISGPGLGLLRQPQFTTAATILLPGDMALLFTDGAFEVANRDRDEFGEEALCEAAASSGLARGDAGLIQIEETLLRYSDALCLPDDLTLILLRRNR